MPSPASTLHCWLCGTDALPRSLPGHAADGTGESFTVDFCSVCGTGQLREMPDESRLQQYYDASYYGGGTRKFTRPVQWLFDRSKARIAAAIANALGKPGSMVLDVGCGTGQLLHALARVGVRGTGLERAGGAMRAVSADVRILEAELDDPRIGQDRYDAVIMWHVLEHLRDPARAIRTAHELLRPGGQLVLAVPDNASLQARAFGAHWFHLDLPRHLHFLARAPLQRYLTENGFEISPVRLTESSQSVYGFVQSTLNALFPHRPNRLYSLLRGARDPGSLAELACWLVPAGLLLPVALAELLAARLGGSTATCTVFAIRR